MSLESNLKRATDHTLETYSHSKHVSDTLRDAANKELVRRRARRWKERQEAMDWEESKWSDVHVSKRKHVYDEPEIATSDLSEHSVESLERALNYGELTDEATGAILHELAKRRKADSILDKLIEKGKVNLQLAKAILLAPNVERALAQYKEREQKMIDEQPRFYVRKARSERDSKPTFAQLFVHQVCVIGDTLYIKTADNKALLITEGGQRFVGTSIVPSQEIEIPTEVRIEFTV